MREKTSDGLTSDQVQEAVDYLAEAAGRRLMRFVSQTGGIPYSTLNNIRCSAYQTTTEAVLKLVLKHKRDHGLDNAPKLTRSRSNAKNRKTGSDH